MNDINKQENLEPNIFIRIVNSIFRQDTAKVILMFIVGIFLLAFTLSPFIWMVFISLTKKADFLSSGEEITFTMQNYVNVLTSDSLNFMDYLKNSLIVATVTSILVTLVTSLSGYAVSRMKFPGRILIPLLVLAMSMFPQISIVGYLYQFFTSLGLRNTYIALILPYIAWNIPIALWINMSYFTQIPVDLDKAALVDGASRTKTLFKVILPIALPGIFSSFLLIFISCFNEFLFAIMLTKDVNAQTLPVGIAFFQGLHGEMPWGNLMAASAIAAVPLVILTLIFQRYIVQGLAGGAVKG
jgi:multiple sugar transport system permease protein